MPIPSAVQDLVQDAQSWRRDIHQDPELLYDVERTARYVADRLTAFGCDEVKTSIGRTGVVGVIRGAKGSSPRSIGLRADMDALPIEEATNLSYRSKNPGQNARLRPRRAYGDAARRGAAPGSNRATSPAMLSSSSSPPKRAARAPVAMIDDGLMDQFGIEEVYGMHNWPVMPVGSFMLRKGPLHGRRRRDHDHDRRSGRPCGDAASMRRSGGRRGADRARPADDRFAKCRSARFLRRFDHPVRGRLGQQHHPSDRPGSTARRARSRPRRATRSKSESTRSPPVLPRQPALTARVEYRRGYPRPSTIRRRPSSPPRSRARSQATPMSIRTSPQSWARKTFRSCSRRARARSSSSAMATARNSISPAYDFNDAALPYGMSYWVELVETALKP